MPREQSHWEICSVCKGEGTLDNLGVVNPHDFSDQEWEDYLGGRFRTRCETCNGTGKVRSDASKPIVLAGSDGQPVVYDDPADASEHRLRMQEGEC